MPHETENGLSTIARIAVVVLVVWAAVINLSDFVRVFAPMDTLGFLADDAGRVTSVFALPASGKLKPGDQLDLKAMSCWGEIASKHCSDLLSILGGMGGIEYVVPWHAPIDLTATRGGHRFSVTLKPERAEPLLFTRFALLADEVLAAIFIAIAAMMVWQFPNRGTWGFFAYALWFNPGQLYAAYAVLQTNPALMFAQEVAQAAAMAVGYAGFLWFVLRFPDDVPEKRWQLAEAAIPVVGVVFFVVQLWAFLNAFGIKTQSITIFSFTLAFVYDAFILFILYVRSRQQKPLERQRLRWVLWGAAIGLPPFISAEALSLYGPHWAEGIIYALYACNAFVAIAVYHAVKRYRVVDVRFAVTRRATLLLTWIIFGAAFALVGDAAAKRLQGLGVVWLLEILAVVIVTLTFEKLHDAINITCDRLFFGQFHKAERILAETAPKLHEEEDVDEIDRLLVEVPFRQLQLVSAAIFVADDEGFVRRREFGWHHNCLDRLTKDHVVVEQTLRPRRRLRIRDESIIRALPSGDAMPVVGIPIFENRALTGIALYSGHARGDDLNKDELRILAMFVGEAGEAYGRAVRRTLEKELGMLQADLEVLRAEAAMQRRRRPRSLRAKRSVPPPEP